MVSMRPGITREEIIQELTERAQDLWGDERAKSMAASLEQAAQQLWAISRHLPNRDVEPGFYQ